MFLRKLRCVCNNLVFVNGQKFKMQIRNDIQETSWTLCKECDSSLVYGILM